MGLLDNFGPDNAIMLGASILGNNGTQPYQTVGGILGNAFSQYAQTMAQQQLLQQQQQYREMQMQKMQQEMQQRKMVQDAGGYQRYVDTGERVFPDAQVQQKPTSDVQNYEYYVQQETASGRKPLSYGNWKLAGAKAGATNIDLSKPMFEIPSGYMPKDPNDLSKGVTAIPGGPKDVSSMEAAGKTQMLRVAEKYVPQIETLLFNSDGTLNRLNAANAQANTPMTDGRKVGALMEVGIQAITRLETGAAMPPSDVEMTRKRFQPSVFDDDATARVKMDMYEEFITGSLKLLDPAGRLDEERFNFALQSRLAEAQSGGFDLEEMPDPKASAGMVIEDAEGNVYESDGMRWNKK